MQRWLLIKVVVPLLKTRCWLQKKSQIVLNYSIFKKLCSRNSKSCFLTKKMLIPLGLNYSFGNLFGNLCSWMEAKNYKYKMTLFASSFMMAVYGDIALCLCHCNTRGSHWKIESKNYFATQHPELLMPLNVCQIMLYFHFYLFVCGSHWWSVYIYCVIM